MSAMVRGGATKAGSPDCPKVDAVEEIISAATAIRHPILARGCIPEPPVLASARRGSIYSRMPTYFNSSGQPVRTFDL
jgi:hypothetical protein